MLSAKIKIDDKDMFKELKKMKSAVLEVGYFNEKKYEAIDKPFYSNVAKPNGKPRKFTRQAEKTAAEVAIANEFGGGKRPPRAFMRNCWGKNYAKWIRFVQDVLPQNMDIVKTFWKLGDKIKGDLSETILNWKYPPNAPSTIKRKGFNKPLVDSGNMSSDFIDIKVNGITGEQ